MDVSKNVRGIVKDFTCGFCTAQSGYNIVLADYCAITGSYGDLVVGKIFAVVSCHDCKMQSLLIFDVYEEERGLITIDVLPEIYLEDHPEVIASFWDNSSGGFLDLTYACLMGQYPYGRKFNSKIPETITHELEESGNCLSVGAYNASALMCGRAVERLVEYLGVKYESSTAKIARLYAEGHLDDIARESLLEKEDLSTSIDKLHTTQKIDGVLYKTLSEIRKWRNQGSHTGDTITLGHSDVELLLKLSIEAVEYASSQERQQSVTDELSDRRKKRRG